MAKLRPYNVHVVPKRPAHNDRGVTLTIHAKTKREAAQLGRERVRHRDMTYDRLDGPLVVTVTEGEDA